MLVIQIVLIYALYIFLMNLWSKRYENCEMGSIEMFLFLTLLIPAYPLMFIKMIFWTIKNKFKTNY